MRAIGGDDNSALPARTAGDLTHPRAPVSIRLPPHPARWQHTHVLCGLVQARGAFGGHARGDGDGGASLALSDGDSTHPRAPGSATSATASGSPAALHSPLPPLPSLEHVQRGGFVVLGAPGSDLPYCTAHGGLDPVLAFPLAGRPLWLAKVVGTAGEGTGTEGSNIGLGLGPGGSSGSGGLKLHLFARAPGARHFAPAVDGRGYPLMHPTSSANPVGQGELLAEFEGLERGRRGGGGRLPRAVAAELAERLQGASGRVGRLYSTEEGDSGNSENEG